LSRQPFATRMSTMTESEKYRVQVYLVGFDKERAPELKSILKIYKRDKGNEYLQTTLKRAWEGQRVLVHETNDDTDAMRFAGALFRGGARIEIDGLHEDKPEF
jgi:hypothetical protein